MLLQNKIALIFGASGGLGQAISKKYIDNGAHVISVGRNIQTLEAIDDYAQEKNSSTTIVQLDIKETDKIYHLSSELQKKFGKIDILISTIAILGEITPLNHYNEKIWQEVISINLNSHWHIIKSMHHLLEQTNPSTAIFCNCSMSSKNNAYWGAYSVSKAGLEQLVKVYKEETTNTNINVQIIDTGPIATNLRTTAFPGKSKLEFKDPNNVANIFVHKAKQALKNQSRDKLTL